MTDDALRRVVEVVDRLLSPGGCPWDAEQTHESLVPYLIEEAYEAVDAVAGAGTPDGDAELADELGDVLLQVVFHARIAAGRGAFDIDDVARGLVDKLVRRHPHVFGEGDARVDVADAEEVQRNWDRLKAVEKPDRGLLDGIPTALPALARAQKVLGRTDGTGRTGDPGGTAVGTRPGVLAGAPRDAAEAVGASLFGIVAAARQRGVDAEQALRSYVDVVVAALEGDPGSTSAQMPARSGTSATPIHGPARPPDTSPAH